MMMSYVVHYDPANKGWRIEVKRDNFLAMHHVNILHLKFIHDRFLFCLPEDKDAAVAVEAEWYPA